MEKHNYKMVPFDDITSEARDIAVAWVDNYRPYASMNPQIGQKHKLASDIMNYSRVEALNFAEFIRHNFNDSMVDSWTRNSDNKIFLDIEEVYELYKEEERKKRG